MKRMILFGMVLAVFAVWVPARAATEDEIQDAIDDGLVWLAAQQKLTPGPDDGSWGVQDKVGKTALMYAAGRGQTDIAQGLLAKGADMNVKDNRRLIV